MSDPNAIWRSLLIAAMMFLAAVSTAQVNPASTQSIEAPKLNQYLPEDFGGWRRVALNSAVLPAESELGPGEAVAYRAYADAAGRTITLVVAYGPPLGDSVRLHRPETCYRAQGFSVSNRKISAFDASGASVQVVTMDTENSLRKEAVTYWLRDGDAYVASASRHAILDLKRGVDYGADGALIRISSTGAGAVAFNLHKSFIADFVEALTPAARNMFLVDAAAPLGNT